MFHTSWRWLFVNPDPAVSNEICADHIMRCVHSVVTDVYASAKDVRLPKGNVREHEMHALALSWQAFSHSCSIADLVAATFWPSTGTFTTFYLQDLSTNAFDLCMLGPLAVAQAVVHPLV